MTVYCGLVEESNLLAHWKTWADLGKDSIYIIITFSSQEMLLGITLHTEQVAIALHMLSTPMSMAVSVMLAVVVVMDCRNGSYCWQQQ